jgi:nucleoid-associated protein YgaU
LATGYWLAGSTILYLIGRTARLPGAIRTVGWATIGPVRRLIDGIVAGALIATIGLPANAGMMTGPGYVPVPAGDPAAGESAAPGSVQPGTPILPTQPLPIPAIDEPESVAPQVTVSNGPSEVVVRPGDHMWALAERKLTLVLGREVSDTEIAPYWLKLVGTNLSRIRSGDPDLIFPGEILLLPEVDP